MSTIDGPADTQWVRASVIVLSYNGLEETTRPCLESILRNTPAGSYELILVDNASTDGTQEFLRNLAAKHSHIRLCLNEVNKGFAGGNNDGMSMALGDYLVLLNNDTLVGAGWLDDLLRAFASDANVGLVGPVTNAAGNEQRIDIPGLDADNFEETAGVYTERQKGVLFQTEKLGFFCVAMLRTLTNEVGYLDERFGIGMFEDDDYCVRVRKAGYSLAVVEDCFVFHKGSMSFRKLPTQDYLKLFSENRVYFFEKHGLGWTYSDIAIAAWKRIRSDFEKEPAALDVASQRIRYRLSLMEDALHQIKRIEEQSIKIGEHSLAEKLLSEKHRQLMEISDWASALQKQNESLAVTISEKHGELMKLSDWASSLNNTNQGLSQQLHSIRASRLYRLVRRFIEVVH